MNSFDRLAPFVQEFIWAKQWTHFRKFQDRAIAQILDTETHILLTAATASGKTEAAMLPILTALDQNPPSGGTGVLYIGPLKALINDQFERINELLKYGDIPVTAWHGDIGAPQRNRFLDKPAGILQTTPESLQGFFHYRSNVLAKIFRDLRFVVIDEIHAFMGSDRGRQLLCLIERLERELQIAPRRIGLSATLGDYSKAVKWLQGTSPTKAVVIDGDEQGTREIRFQLRHEIAPGGDMEDKQLLRLGPNNISALYSFTKTGKSLVFAGSRGNAESVTFDLRKQAKLNGTEDIYHVHHGSVSKEFRFATEEAMREAEKPACTVATSTLELGIDLGQLDRVAQIGPPITVSSFVQRLGRSGRRDNASTMLAITQEVATDAQEIQHAPWRFLQMLAIANLYFTDRWVEPITAPRLPYSLLYHQTMSVLLMRTEMQPTKLADEVLALSPFKHVPRKSFEVLLNHLLRINHLELTEERTLIVGLAAEKMVNHHSFLATFQENADFKVFDGAKHIGTLQEAPPEGAVFFLTGRRWQVESIDHTRKTIFAVKSTSHATALWRGSMMDIHSEVINAVRTLLQHGEAPKWVTGDGKKRLKEVSQLAREHQITDGPVIMRTGNKSCLIFPWAGSKVTRTLIHALGNKAQERTLYFFEFRGSKREAQKALKVFAQTGAGALQIEPENVPRENKFDWAIPSTLLLDSYITDRLAITEAQATAHTLAQGR